MNKKYALLMMVGMVFAVSAPAYAGYWDKKTDAAAEAEQEVDDVVADAAAKESPKPVAAAAKAVVAQAHSSAAPVAPTPAAPTKDELMNRSLKGVENQKAWVGTLEKQLAGEKAKLAQMESDHAKNYGGSSKKA